MNRKISVLLSSAALVSALPMAAQADVTAQDVWANWQAALELYGSSVNVGDQSASGGMLTLNDITMSVDAPDGTAMITVDNITLKELGDGTVSISMSEEIPYAITSAVDETAEVDIEMVLRQIGLNIIASGDPDAITYAYSADSIGMDFDKFVVADEEIEPIVELAVKDIQGLSSTRSGETWVFESEGTAGELTMAMSFDDPQQDNGVTMEWSVLGMDFVSSSEMTDGYDMTDVASMFSGALTGKANITMGTSTFSMAASGSDNFELTGSAESQTLNYEIGNGGINYGGTARGSSMTFASSDMPFPPVTVSVDASEFAFGMPMTETAEPAGFQLLLALRGLSTDDFLWDMIDPGNVLPRDPATLVIDTEGKARLLGNIFDPEFAEDFEGDMPAELHNLSVNEIALAIAGASIQGSGNFTFDNSDLDTFDGLPAPTGALNFELFGINTLLENLGQAGLLPDDQAMGARMMLGLFARPGSGEDTLTSTIEVEGDGSIYANGQQLR